MLEQAEVLALDFNDYFQSFPLKISTTVPTAKEIRPDVILVFAKFEALLAIEFFAASKKFDLRFLSVVAVGLFKVISVWLAPEFEAKLVVVLFENSKISLDKYLFEYFWIRYPQESIVAS
jgi:hypothetical protein